jgi:hypothetical protein
MLECGDKFGTFTNQRHFVWDLDVPPLGTAHEELGTNIVSAYDNTTLVVNSSRQNLEVRSCHQKLSEAFVEIFRQIMIVIVTTSTSSSIHEAINRVGAASF